MAALTRGARPLMLAATGRWLGGRVVRLPAALVLQQPLEAVALVSAALAR